MHDHPFRRHLDAFLTLLFGGASAQSYLGLFFQCVMAIAAGISGYVTLKRFFWDAVDRGRRESENAKDREIARLKAVLAVDGPKLTVADPMENTQVLDAGKVERAAGL
jgi:hypothetical protein